MELEVSFLVAEGWGAEGEGCFRAGEKGGQFFLDIIQ